MNLNYYYVVLYPGHENLQRHTWKYKNPVLCPLVKVSLYTAHSLSSTYKIPPLLLMNPHDSATENSPFVWPIPFPFTQKILPSLPFPSYSRRAVISTKWYDMAIFLHKLPYRKNAIHFLTMAIFPYGNFPIHQTKPSIFFSWNISKNQRLLNRDSLNLTDNMCALKKKTTMIYDRIVNCFVSILIYEASLSKEFQAFNLSLLTTVNFESNIQHLTQQFWKLWSPSMLKSSFHIIGENYNILFQNFQADYHIKLVWSGISDKNGEIGFSMK